MPSHDPIPVEGNLLLDALDPRDRALVAPHLVRIECARGTVLFEVGRGRIHILDRGRAEAACCECHARVRRHFKAVMGAVRAPGGEVLAVEATPLAAGPSRRAETTRHGAQGAAR